MCCLQIYFLKIKSWAIRRNIFKQTYSRVDKNSMNYILVLVSPVHRGNFSGVRYSHLNKSPFWLPLYVFYEIGIRVLWTEMWNCFLSDSFTSFAREVRLFAVKPRAKHACRYRLLSPFIVFIAALRFVHPSMWNSGFGGDILLLLIFTHNDPAFFFQKVLSRYKSYRNNKLCYFAMLRQVCYVTINNGIERL